MPRVYYNLGMAHLRLGNAEQAVSFLQKYLLAEPDAPPEVRQKAQEALAQALALRSATTLPPVSPPPRPLPPVEMSAPATVLEPEPAPAALPATPEPAAATATAVRSPETKARRPRPAWRIGAGVVGLAAGSGLVGLGLSALSVHGRCADMHMPFQTCTADYHTIDAGAALTISGFLLIHLGTLAIALPPPAR